MDRFSGQGLSSVWGGETTQREGTVRRTAGRQGLVPSEGVTWGAWTCLIGWFTQGGRVNMAAN